MNATAKKPAKQQTETVKVDEAQLGHVATTCIETAYGTTTRLSFQIKVF